MKNNKILAVVSAAVLAAGVLAGCGSSKTADTAASSDAAATSAATEADAAATAAATEAAKDGAGEKITVAASVTPHAEILAKAKEILAGQGYDLEVKEFEDYVQPNNVVESKKSLDEVADGDAIAVPNDTTNEARALLLLQQEGLIKLKDGAGITATVNDIAENPHNLKIVEIEAAQVSKQLPDVAYAVINGNYAMQAGLSVEKDALAVESADGDAIQQYVNIIAVKEGNESLPKIKALTDVLHSDEIKQFINDTYKGSVVPYEGEQ